MAELVQLGLFGEPVSGEPDRDEEADGEVRALASRLPPHVRLGTSSWTFPGWAGICYPKGTTEKALMERGLALYARHPLFGTVGIDRSYYAPIPEPELARYASQLPPGFRCVMKVWSRITTRADPRTGEVFETYLDPDAFVREVADPVRRAFGEHLGALVFEFPPHRTAIPSPEAFADQLHAFLGALPGDLPYSVELRTRSLLSRPYLEVLREHRAAHVLNLWEAMPDLGEQLALPGVLPADFVVARLMLRPGTRYADRKAAMAPFDRIVDANEEMRADVAELVRLTGALDKVLYVIVNNKMEGSSPLTVRALAERIAEE